MANQPYSNSGAGVRAWIQGFKHNNKTSNISVFSGESLESMQAKLATKPTQILINQVSSEATADYENQQNSGTIDSIEVFYMVDNRTAKPDKITGKKNSSKDIIPALEAYLMTPFKFTKWFAGVQNVTATYKSSTNLENNVKQIIIEVA
jgi:hypothetical protein